MKRIGAAVSLLLASSLLAHDTWLMPLRFTAAPEHGVRLDLTSGMAFPQLEYPIKAPRVARAVVRCGTSEQPLPRPQASDKSLQFEARCQGAGVAAVVVELKPKSLELNAKQIAEYVEEIGATWALNGALKSGKKRWREEYVKHAKTFIRVGVKQDEGWKAPMGMRLEIVPLADPTRLHPGDSLEVVLLEDGKPLPQFPLGVMHEKEHGTLVTTDANGHAIVRLAKGGRWLLRATRLRPSSKPNLEWESDFTTMTFGL